MQRKGHCSLLSREYPKTFLVYNLDEYLYLRNKTRKPLSKRENIDAISYDKYILLMQNLSNNFLNKLTIVLKISSYIGDILIF